MVRPFRRHGALPDFIIIGAMKCATSSIFYNLRRHPALGGCSMKEPGYFSDSAWHRGIDWYRGLFPRGDRIRFEASTNYAKFPASGPVPERMHRTVPDARLVYIVRHPIERLLSHFHHEIARDRARQEQALSPEFWKQNGKHFVRCSLYHHQLSQYLPYFDLSRILVLRFEDFVADGAGVLNEILRFVGVTEGLYPDGFPLEKRNTVSTRARVKFRRVHRFLEWAHRRRLLPPVHGRLETPVPRPVLRLDDELRLWRTFEQDLAKFEALTGKEFHYAPPSGALERDCRSMGSAAPSAAEASGRVWEVS